MPPGSGSDRLVDVVSVLMETAYTLAVTGQGVLQNRAAQFGNIWLGGICGLWGISCVYASDGGHTDGQGDQGEEGLHDDEDEFL